MQGNTSESMEIHVEMPRESTEMYKIHGNISESHGNAQEIHENAWEYIHRNP
jgi:hypothetical protein